MNVCIIPARGGSKRVPRKNIKDFCGKPMIGYAIEAAKLSNLFKHIIVSTDDREIASISVSFGAIVPFMRPDFLSTDYVGTVDVIAHALEEVDKIGIKSKQVCCMYPCVPLLEPNDLVRALALLEATEQAYYSFPVAEFPSTVQRGLKRRSDGMMVSCFPKSEQMRTQDLESIYFDAGQFYWGHRSSWCEKITIHNNGVGYLIPTWRAVDVDTLDDWTRAEHIFKAHEALKMKNR